MSVNTYSDHYFIFGGVDSRTYGMVVSNDNGFDAPERDVKEVEIPGRNGSLVLDNGRYKNQTLTYSCVLKSGFDTQMDAFRAALCAKMGYQRITDSFHPGVYRMGRIKGEIRTTPGSKYQNGHFEIDFDVKPQKFLLTGETAVSVSSGGTLTNPTAYAAKPMLQVWGYGDIWLDAGRVSIEDAPLGYVELVNSGDLLPSIIVDDRLYQTGDPLGIKRVRIGIDITTFSDEITAVAASNNTTGLSFVGWWYFESGANKGVHAEYVYTGADFVAGTAKTISLSSTLTLTHSGGTETETMQCDIDYSMTRFNATISVTGDYMEDATVTAETIYADSSISVLGTPTYIDLDIGEAWAVRNGEMVFLNNQVLLPVTLPDLPVGDTEVNYDNTVTQLKIVPRWWTI